MPTTTPPGGGVTNLPHDHEASPIRFDEFAAAVKAHRKKLEFSLVQASEATGVSPATLSRVENAKLYPRFETIHTLCNWMKIPLSEFMVSPTEFNERDTLEKVAVHLRADKNLSHKAADEIVNFVRALYNVKSHRPKDQE